MVQHSGETAHVRLIRCHHGTYHLTVGATTLRLTEDEVAFVARAIHAMSRSHPMLHARMLSDEQACDPTPPPPPPTAEE